MLKKNCQSYKFLTNLVTLFVVDAQSLSKKLKSAKSSKPIFNANDEQLSSFTNFSSLAEP